MKRVLLALALSACAGSPARVSMEAPAKLPRPSDYVDEVKKWTRHGNLRQDFDEALDVDATMRSPEFRAAYAERWISVFRLGAEDAARVRAQLSAEGADTIEFHVETAMHNYDLNDLSSGKTVWRVALVDDQGREVTTKDIHATRERREVEKDFYPYATLFSRGWTLRFPRTRADGSAVVGPQTKSLTLRFAGPLGSVDLVWYLSPSA